MTSYQMSQIWTSYGAQVKNLVWITESHQNPHPRRNEETFHWRYFRSGLGPFGDHRNYYNFYTAFSKDQESSCLVDSCCFDDKVSSRYS